DFSKENTQIRYLNSLLVPETGSTSIPDDTLDRHCLKTETTTENLVAALGGSGLIVLFPNSPSGLLGAHYTKTPQGSLIFDKAITTSQDLKKAYNYARLVSRIVQVRSSTLPAGVYALNGTFNGVTYIGSLSEIKDLDYNSLLSATANINDKVGNVLVGDGVAVLSLPAGSDLPYVRLGDEVPSSAGVARCSPSDRPRHYNANNKQVQVGTTDTKTNGFNIDATTPTEVTVDMQIAQIAAGKTLTVTVKLMGLTGAKVASRSETVSGNGGTFHFSTTAVFGETEITQPVVGVQVLAKTNGDPIVVDSYVGVTVHGGNMPGTLRPVTIIAYESVATGSVLTLSGISNYELIPNPELAKNIQTSYGKLNPAEMTYTKVVLSHRDELGLRSIWSIPQYRDMMSYFREVSDRSSPLKIAGA
nr:VP2 protein [Blotched snakehead virus]